MRITCCISLHIHFFSTVWQAAVWLSDRGEASITMHHPGLVFVPVKWIIFKTFYVGLHQTITLFATWFRVTYFIIYYNHCYNATMTTVGYGMAILFHVDVIPNWFMPTSGSGLWLSHNNWTETLLSADMYSRSVYLVTQQPEPCVLNIRESQCNCILSHHKSGFLY